MNYTQQDIEQAKAFIKERVNAEISMQKHVDEALLWAATQIVAIAYKYKIKAAMFRFSANKELMKEVNQVIEKLRQMLYQYTETLSVHVDNSSRKQIIDYINIEQYGKTLKERIAIYTNRFKYELEAFIAAGLLWKYPIAKLINTIKQDLAAPYNNKLFKDSVKKGGLSATRIITAGISYGNGRSNSARNLLNNLSRNTIAQAWMYIYGQKAIQNGAIGFFSYRGSSYPCSHCDDLTGFHHIQEYRGYWHPNCRCFFIFVYNN